MSQVCRFPAMMLSAIVLIIGITSPLSAQEVPWRYDYMAARREAREKNKPLVLDFGTVDCSWCKKLDATTFRDPAIVKALTERFIPVKIDASKDPALAQALGINSFPTLVFAAPNGKILGQHDGYVEVKPFSEQLERLLADASPTMTGPAIDTNVQAADRSKQARELLAQAKEEFRIQNDAGCLDRCRTLTATYGDLPEGVEADRLAARIKNDPARLSQACDKLTDSLGDTYLELAESLLKKGQTQQALACYEKTIRICAGTRPAQLAQERLLQVRDQHTRQPEQKPVIRGISP